MPDELFESKVHPYISDLPLKYKEVMELLKTVWSQRCEIPDCWTKQPSLLDIFNRTSNYRIKKYGHIFIVLCYSSGISSHFGRSVWSIMFHF